MGFAKGGAEAPRVHQSSAVSEGKEPTFCRSRSQGARVTM